VNTRQIRPSIPPWSAFQKSLASCIIGCQAGIANQSKTISGVNSSALHKGGMSSGSSSTKQGLAPLMAGAGAGMAESFITYVSTSIRDSRGVDALLSY
jgi:hypothetical protein